MFESSNSTATAQTAVSLPNTRRLDFTSGVNGRRYALHVALPFDPPPPSGYGVFYVLDGYAYFASAVEAVRCQGHTRNSVVVVGVGYPDDPSWIGAVLERHSPLTALLQTYMPFMAACTLERTYDLTLPASEELLAAERVPGRDNRKASDVGGLDGFLQVIETEVKPQVAAMVQVDSSNQALFGHSFGGLAALHALFTAPNTFRTFIAASPAIYWNRNAVLAGEPAFTAAVRAGKAAPRVLITVGGEEQTAKVSASPGVDQAKLEAVVRNARLVDNAIELADRLKALSGSGRFKVEDCAVFDRVEHALAAWSALARAIGFAFPPV